MRLALAGIAVFAACGSSSNVTGPPGEQPDPIIDAPVSIDDAAVTDTTPLDAGPDRGAEQDADDLAFALGEIFRGFEMPVMMDGMDIGYAITIPTFTNPTPGEWTGARGTQTFDYIYHCEDDAGNDNFTCGPTANHVHVAATITGSTTIDTLTLGEDKLSSHWTVRNISAGAPQFEDTARLLITCTLGSDATKFQLTLDGTWNEVRFDPEPATSMPFGGNIAYTLTGKRHRAAATPTDVDLAFSPTITFAAGGATTISIDATHNYTFDLSTGAVTKL